MFTFRLRYIVIFYPGHLGQSLYDASRAKEHGCMPLLPQRYAAQRHDLLFVWSRVAQG